MVILFFLQEYFKVEHNIFICFKCAPNISYFPVHYYLMKHSGGNIQEPFANTIGVHLPNQFFSVKQIRTIQYLAELLNANCTSLASEDCNVPSRVLWLI